MIERIAYYLNRNDEEPNTELAVLLCSTRDKDGIREIVQGLKSNTQQIANDCIKVLYEIGEREPELISEFVLDFIELLDSKNNRLVWGGMTALSQIALLKSEAIYQNLDRIISAYERGSVITVDNAISVFARLCKADKNYEKVVFGIILKHLKTCRPKEVAQHSERAFECINKSNAKEFINVLTLRKEALTEAQNKRIDKLIKRSRVWI